MAGWCVMGNGTLPSEGTLSRRSHVLHLHPRGCDVCKASAAAVRHRYHKRLGAVLQFLRWLRHPALMPRNKLSSASPRSSLSCPVCNFRLHLLPLPSRCCGHRYNPVARWFGQDAALTCLPSPVRLVRFLLAHFSIALVRVLATTYCFLAFPFMQSILHVLLGAHPQDPFLWCQGLSLLHRRRPLGLAGASWLLHSSHQYVPPRPSLVLGHHVRLARPLWVVRSGDPLFLPRHVPLGSFPWETLVTKS
jgi:hypothetical protein